MITLKNVIKDYPLGKTVVHAVRGVDLSINRGEFTAIAGPSGSGKTTLLNLIGCVDVATKGQVIVNGHDTGTLNDAALTELRLHHLGFIFQTFNLVQVLTVVQNIEFPLLLQGTLTPKKRRKAVAEIIDRVGIAPQAKQRPSELSGGQRQRVAIARALVTRPSIVLADEPTANLDSVTGESILELMKELNREAQTTFVFSTHDPKVMEHARGLIRIEDGKIVQDNRATAAA